MDDARDAPLELGLEGDHVASVALGDDRLLQEARILARADDVAQASHHSLAGRPAIPSQASQGDAGAVEHAPFVVQAAAYLLDEAGQGTEATSLRGQQRALIRAASERPSQSASSDESVAHRKQLAGPQHSAKGRPLHQGAHIMSASWGQLGLRRKQGLGLCGLLDAAPHCGLVGRWAQTQGQLGTHGEGGVLGELIENLEILKDCEVLVVHMVTVDA